MEAALDLYPPKPANVPKDLARPTLRYRFHAWLAMWGLLVFATIYAGLGFWFGWAAWRNLAAGFSPGGDFWHIVRGLGAGILTVFMVKGMFFRKHSGVSREFEVTKENQPRLFDFLNRIADEAGAPRPHKVFLSPQVNACVFYDLSLLNFFFPTRKNLEIGLSLVNVLTLSEFKAVLAHEFGHFAQRSMAVGRWVYTAQQVATQVIYHRDALDGFLNGLSRFDLRIAWIGWLLRLIVWSIRSILDTMLHFVMLAERALSREMEFQADLVAVSTTGSDALIHGLHRLAAADSAWDEAKDLVTERLKKDHKIEDVFAVHSRVLEHQRRVLDDPDYGLIPPLPENNREAHRVFKAEFAQPPQMWATRPQSHLREDNAKKRYIQAELNDRSAWDIFDNPNQLREQLTAHLFCELKFEVETLADTFAAVDEHFAKEYYNPIYRGIYLKRSVVEYAKRANDLYYRDGAVTRT
ncbi:MAG: M48 family metallopeptidase, partial [Verrucomicrobiota bacterium]